MMGKIPKANELKENESKFIQVYVHNEPYLVFASKKEGIYHGFMLEDFLKEFEINFKTFKDKSGLGEIPIKEDIEENYKLVGAGKVSRLFKGNFEFYGSSRSYHVGTNLKHLEEVFEDKKPKIEKVNNFNYFVRFNNSQEDETSEFSIKSNLNIEKISEDEVPF